MNPSIVSSISRLANYMPLGSYVIYTALETYSFSLGTSPSPITTIIQTPAYNYTCLYIPGGTFTYTSCTTDQSNALCISLSIGFFLAVFLSFLKHVPLNGTPPLADEDGDDGPGDGDNTVVVDDSTQTLQLQLQQQGGQVVRVKVGGKHKKIKYRSGVMYAQGNYYLDFGDYHIWGHALLSFVAFGTLSLFSSSVSQCLFPKVKPWIFVFTQIILLVICAFIAMFWIDDPSLSIGLMVAPPTDSHATQTAGGAVSMISVSNGGTGSPGLSPGQFAAAATSNASTSTASAFPTMNLAQFSTSSTGAGTGTTTSSMFNNKNISSSSVFSASTAVNGNTNTCSCNHSTNSNGNSTTTSSSNTGIAGATRLSGFSKRAAPTMSSVNEKQGDEEVHELSDRRSSNSNSNSPILTSPTTTAGGGRTSTSQEWSRGEGGSTSALVQGIMIASSLDSSSPPPPAPPGSTSPSSSSDHVSVKMD
ncbi:hypothetical protein K457DRAFT_17158 [Linnemannia elongata AG-77]|uniref:Uncharacterized protein n=1 Tax=Linnemannia elongata AG-77 TaxID=1314771 RepID=A0A197K431_9FUNG|nr:hypothetical protein K457DRAFT_17158 [Linnemannia elongata AG-77]